MLQLKDAFVISSGPGHTVQIVMITKNETKKVVKLSNNSELVTAFFLLERLENAVYGVDDLRIFFREMMIDQDLLAGDLLHVAGAQGALL